uniref:Uncharacterized protein n=1 Tax=Panagrolaimus davidi TaxID=227884 RepID=A0A914QJT4_9BILA
MLILLKKVFVLRNISRFGLFKFQLFKEFILKNAEHECHVRIDFKLIDEDYVEARELNDVLLELGTQYSKNIKLHLENIKLRLKKKNNLESML